MAHQFELRAADRRYVIGELGAVHIMVFRGESTIEDLRLADRYHTAQRARMGAQKTSVLALVEPGTPLPSAEYRAASAQMMAETGPKLASSAVVVATEGFAGSLYRSLLTTIYVLSRQPVMSKVFAGSLDAATWTAQMQQDLTLDPIELANALESMRRM